MDQIKIGKFIAECRKRNNLTQAQLAEKLFISDRAISKWENGKSMPDSSIMLALCKELKITVNDLLNGEIVSMENYNQQTEKKLIEMVKEKEQADKQLLKLEIVIGILFCLVLLIPIILGAYLPIEKDWIRILIVCSGVIPCFIGIYFALKIEQTTGFYKCKKCGHRYVPTFKSVNLAMHIGRTRYLKCPKCNKKSWNKKVISKNDE